MGMYLTYISKKQAGAIFANYKNGNIKVDGTLINWMYKHCVEVRGYNHDHDYDDVLQRVKDAVDCVFKNDYEEAAKELKGAYNLYSCCYTD